MVKISCDRPFKVGSCPKKRGNIKHFWEHIALEGIVWIIHAILNWNYVYSPFWDTGLINILTVLMKIQINFKKWKSRIFLIKLIIYSVHSEVWSKHTVEWLKRCFQEHPVKLLHGKIMSHPVEKNVILNTLFWKCMYRGRVAYLRGNLTLSKLAILSVWWKMKIYVYKKVVKIPRVNNMVINLCNTNLLSQESGYTRGEL